MGEAKILTHTPSDSVPLWHEAMVEVLSSSDGGAYIGYQEGYEGKPMREFKPDVPELFRVCYAEAYKRGKDAKTLELESQSRTQEIAKYESLLGCTQETSQHKEGTMDKTQVAPVAPQRSSFVRKAIPIIIAGTVGMVFGGVIGITIGAKRQAKKERDLGIGSSQVTTGTR